MHPYYTVALAPGSPRWSRWAARRCGSGGAADRSRRAGAGDGATAAWSSCCWPGPRSRSRGCAGWSARVALAVSAYWPARRGGGGLAVAGVVVAGAERSARGERLRRGHRGHRAHGQHPVGRLGRLRDGWARAAGVAGPSRGAPARPRDTPGPRRTGAAPQPGAAGRPAPAGTLRPAVPAAGWGDRCVRRSCGKCPGRRSRGRDGQHRAGRAALRHRLDLVRGGRLGAERRLAGAGQRHRGDVPRRLGRLGQRGDARAVPAGRRGGGDPLLRRRRPAAARVATPTRPAHRSPRGSRRTTRPAPSAGRRSTTCPADSGRDRLAVPPTSTPVQV